jgi:hypothetical protein
MFFAILQLCVVMRKIILGQLPVNSCQRALVLLCLQRRIGGKNPAMMLVSLFDAAGVRRSKCWCNQLKSSIQLGLILL